MDNCYIFLKCGKTAFYIPEGDEVVNPVSQFYYKCDTICYRFDIGGRLQGESPRVPPLGNVLKRKLLIMPLNVEWSG
jgi:hypothetical protein